MIKNKSTVNIDLPVLFHYIKSAYIFLVTVFFFISIILIYNIRIEGRE